MSKNVRADQRQRIVEELADIATKLKTDRDHPTTREHAIEAFNEACVQAGWLVVDSIESGLMPSNSGVSKAWKEFAPKSATDRDIGFFWALIVGPWLRSIEKRGHIRTGAGNCDFPHYKRNKSGKLVDAKGKPLKLAIVGKDLRRVKWDRLKSEQLKGLVGSSSRYEGEPAAIEDDHDDASRIRHMRRRLDDLIHECQALVRFLLGVDANPARKPLTNTQKMVFNIIKSKGPVTGKEIIRISDNTVTQSSLTTHVIPALKKHGVRNSGDGYYVEEPMGH